MVWLLHPPRWQCRGHSSYAPDFAAAYMGRDCSTKDRFDNTSIGLLQVENVNIPKRNFGGSEFLKKGPTLVVAADALNLR